MNIRNLLLSVVSALVLLSCGGGSGGGMSAGGIGGTGVSSGPVTGFGSVIVNGVEYNTDAAAFTIEGSPAGIGNLGLNKLAVGMTVSVTHDDSNPPLAKSVSYQNNAEGPITIASRNSTTGDGVFTLLGLTVNVNNLTVFANTTGLIGSVPLSDGDIVEVSGQLTVANELMATRVERKPVTCGTSGLQVEVKGTVSNLSTSGDGGFDIESPPLASLHVNANGHLPSTLQNGDYIEIKSSACPTSGTLPATAILKDSSVHEGPDLSELDTGATKIAIKGVVADAGGSAPTCSFTVNGQDVQTTSGTQIAGGNCASLTNGTLIEVQGQLSGRVLIATAVRNEDSESDSTGNYMGVVKVDPDHSTFDGTINVIDSSGDSGPIAVDLNTQFESDTQPYNLDTMDGASTCAEVEVNATSGGKHAISIHREDCPP